MALLAQPQVAAVGQGPIGPPLSVDGPAGPRRAAGPQAAPGAPASKPVASGHRFWLPWQSSPEKRARQKLEHLWRAPPPARAEAGGRTDVAASTRELQACAVESTATYLAARKPVEKLQRALLDVISTLIRRSNGEGVPALEAWRALIGHFEPGASPLCQVAALAYVAGQGCEFLLGPRFAVDQVLRLYGTGEGLPIDSTGLGRLLALFLRRSVGIERPREAARGVAPRAASPVEHDGAARARASALIRFAVSLLPSGAERRTQLAFQEAIEARDRQADELAATLGAPPNPNASPSSELKQLARLRFTIERYVGHSLASSHWLVFLRYEWDRARLTEQAAHFVTLDDRTLYRGLCALLFESAARTAREPSQSGVGSEGSSAEEGQTDGSASASSSPTERTTTLRRQGLAPALSQPWPPLRLAPVEHESTRISLPMRTSFATNIHGAGQPDAVRRPPTQASTRTTNDLRPLNTMPSAGARPTALSPSQASTTASGMALPPSRMPNAALGTALPPSRMPNAASQVASPPAQGRRFVESGLKSYDEPRPIADMADAQQEGYASRSTASRHPQDISELADARNYRPATPRPSQPKFTGRPPQPPASMTDRRAQSSQDSRYADSLGGGYLPYIADSDGGEPLSPVRLESLQSLPDRGTPSAGAGRPSAPAKPSAVTQAPSMAPLRRPTPNFRYSGAAFVNIPGDDGAAQPPHYAFLLRKLPSSTVKLAQQTLAHCEPSDPLELADKQLGDGRYLSALASSQLAYQRLVEQPKTANLAYLVMQEFWQRRLTNEGLGTLQQKVDRSMQTGRYEQALGGKKLLDGLCSELDGSRWLPTNSESVRPLLAWHVQLLHLARLDRFRKQILLDESASATDRATPRRRAADSLLVYGLLIGPDQEFAVQFSSEQRRRLSFTGLRPAASLLDGLEQMVTTTEGQSGFNVRLAGGQKIAIEDPSMLSTVRTDMRCLLDELDGRGLAANDIDVLADLNGFASLSEAANLLQDTLTRRRTANVSQQTGIAL